MKFAFLFSGMLHNASDWLRPVCVFGGMLSVFAALKRKLELRAIIGSDAFVAGLMIAGAASGFSVMLSSILASANSVSAYQNAANGHGLAIALVLWLIVLLMSAYLVGLDSISSRFE